MEDDKEELVAVRASEKIALRPVYYQLSLPGSCETIYLRSGVYQKLKTAAERLPEGLSLLVYDGWRSLELQKYLYENYRAALVASLGPLGESLVNNYVVAPDEDPPHLSGAAVDCGLVDRYGQEVDMGGFYDELSERSETDFYERYPDPLGYRQRRRVLVEALEGAGFSNYPGEWFHYDCGTAFQASRDGSKVLYRSLYTAPSQT